MPLDRYFLFKFLFITAACIIFFYRLTASLMGCGGWNIFRKGCPPGKPESKTP